MRILEAPYPARRLRLLCAVCLGVATAAHLAQAGHQLSDADRAFNEGKIELASQLYVQAEQRALVAGDKWLAGEARNGLAAVAMTRGDYATFAHSKHAADDLKWAAPALHGQPAGDPSGPAGGNLLVNGGFEAGLVAPWGSGHYERGATRPASGRMQTPSIWWNSGGARGYMKIDSALRHSGERSLRSTNFSPLKPHVFLTTSQRISGLTPNTVYRVSMMIKAEKLVRGAVFVTIDAGWEKRIPAFPAGSYDWTRYVAEVNIGHNAYIDVRFVHQVTGSVWIDDIVVEPETSLQRNPWVLAETLFDRAEYAGALEIYESIERDSRSPQPSAQVARGRILTVMGRYDAALDLLRPLAVTGSSPSIQQAIADLYFALGQHELALDHYQLARDGLRGNQAGVARISQRMGDTYLAAADEAVEPARDDLLRAGQQALAMALGIMRHMGERHGEARTLRSFARLHRASGAVGKALQTVREAQPIAAEVLDLALDSDLTLDAAEISLKRDLAPNTIEMVEAAIAMKRRFGDRVGTVRGFEILGRLHKRVGKARESYEAFAAAVAELELAYEGLLSTTPEARTRFVRQFERVLFGHIEAGLALDNARGVRDADIESAIYRSVQWTQLNAASAAIAQMAVRASAVNSKLGSIVRSRQDLGLQLHALQKALSAVFATPHDAISAEAESNIRSQVETISWRLRQVSDELRARFPEYAELANPSPLALEATSRQLNGNEALLLLFHSGDRLLAWLITDASARMRVVPMSFADLAQAVATLRCGLDRAAWYAEGAASCAERLRMSPIDAPAPEDPLPFDAALAHRLYQLLLGEDARAIGDRHLLVVSTGALSALPLSVLVVRAPPVAMLRSEGDFKGLDWLGARNAISVLPAVSTLTALRRVARASSAADPMIGFGSPLLLGAQSDAELGPWMQQRAVLAAAITGCSASATGRSLARRSIRRNLAPLQLEGGHADLDHLRAQTPLPETADELCAVARELGADVAQIRLGARATEREVKALSLAGRLSRYRVVHFATHGMLAGQLSGTREPGLVLTPPGASSDEDDGYLSASEIASLKLDADWVILSACNTAGGESAGAEALSGLARVFFYAGARALFVSHWEVDSDATVKLVTTAVRAIATDPGIGRAEALRRAMTALLREGTPRQAHPAYWAPFVIVGEGGALR